MTGYVNFSALPRERLPGRLLRLGLRALPPRLVVPIIQGPLRGSRWIVGAGVHGYWLGSYELDKCTRFARCIPTGGTVFDVGANVGYYTLLASKMVGPRGTVVAVEPLPRNVLYLQKHLALNKAANVRVFAAAATDRAGRTLFDVGPGPSFGHAGGAGQLDVTAITLDDLFREHQLPLPDVIKMDIEGGELDALRGATRVLSEGRSTIFLATHGADVHRDCCELLVQRGYRLASMRAGVPLELTDELIATRSDSAADVAAE